MRNELAVLFHSKTPVVHSQTAADGVDECRLPTAVHSHNAVQLPRERNGQHVPIGLEVIHHDLLEIER